MILSWRRRIRRLAWIRAWLTESPAWYQVDGQVEFVWPEELGGGD